MTWKKSHEAEFVLRGSFLRGCLLAVVVLLIALVLVTLVLIALVLIALVLVILAALVLITLVLVVFTVVLHEGTPPFASHAYGRYSVPQTIKYAQIFLKNIIDKPQTG